MLTELGQQSWEPLADLNAEREFYWAQAARAASWLDGQPQKVRLSMRVLTVRCEHGGCVCSQKYSAFRLRMEASGTSRHQELAAMFGYLKYRAYLKCVVRIVDKHGLPALKAVDAIARPSKPAPNTARRGSSEAA